MRIKLDWDWDNEYGLTVNVSDINKFYDYFSKNDLAEEGESILHQIIGEELISKNNK